MKIKVPIGVLPVFYNVLFVTNEIYFKEVD
jgi:hypothetical protein